MLEEISKSFDISSSIIFPNFRENCRDSKYSRGDIKTPEEIPKFSNAHFRNIPENLSHTFDANLADFLPEWKILCLHRENYGKIIGISRGNSR